MIYISGKMTGIENYNYPEFNRVAKALREQGHEVFNPAEIDIDVSMNSEWGAYEAYMDVCLDAIDKCDTIYLLNGWNDSKGAKRELMKAIKLGLKITLQGDFI